MNDIYGYILAGIAGAGVATLGWYLFARRYDRVIRDLLKEADSLSKKLETGGRANWRLLQERNDAWGNVHKLQIELFQTKARLKPFLPKPNQFRSHGRFAKKEAA